MWSHGGRRALEALPADKRKPFKSAAGEQLEARRLPDESMGLHVTVRYTVARRT